MFDENWTEDDGSHRDFELAHQERLSFEAEREFAPSEGNERFGVPRV